MWISETNAGEYSSYGAQMPANTGENGMVSPEMTMYPSVYYIMQPHILVICDQMEMMCGCMMPPNHMMMHMCDQVCDRMLRMHPEMAQYDTPYPDGMMGDPPFGMEQFGGFRRRTPFRDLAFFLLLAELFRRRRR